MKIKKDTKQNLAIFIIAFFLFQPYLVFSQTPKEAKSKELVPQNAIVKTEVATQGIKYEAFVDCIKENKGKDPTGSLEELSQKCDPSGINKLKNEDQNLVSSPAPLSSEKTGVGLNMDSPAIKKKFQDEDKKINLGSDLIKPRNTVSVPSELKQIKPKEIKFSPPKLEPLKLPSRESTKSLIVNPIDSSEVPSENSATTASSTDSKVGEFQDVVHSDIKDCGEGSTWARGIDPQIIGVDSAACSSATKSTQQRITACMRYVTCVKKVGDGGQVSKFLRQALCSPSECSDIPSASEEQQKKQVQTCLASNHAIYLDESDKQKIQNNKVQKSGKSLKQTDAQFQIKVKQK